MEFANYEPAAAGCGAHGVDGVHITGGNTDGDSEDTVAVCSAGEIVRSGPLGGGTWWSTSWMCGGAATC